MQSIPACMFPVLTLPQLSRRRKRAILLKPEQSAVHPPPRTRPPRPLSLSVCHMAHCMGIFLMVGAPAVGSYSSMNPAPLTLQIQNRNVLDEGQRRGDRHGEIVGGGCLSNGSNSLTIKRLTMREKSRNGGMNWILPLYQLGPWMRCLLSSVVNRSEG